MSFLHQPIGMSEAVCQSVYLSKYPMSDDSLTPPTFLEGWGMGTWIDRAYIDSLV